MEGQGKYYFEDGKVYEGGFVTDQRDGHGTLRWLAGSVICRPDGRMYVGQWKAGKMHGLGRVVEPGGKVRAGHWREGVREKPAANPCSTPITPQDTPTHRYARRTTPNTPALSPGPTLKATPSK